MAPPMDVAELQRISQEMLELYVYDPKELRKDCPLDRHVLGKVEHDLGALMQLPLELRYTVFDKLDVQSLFVFRRVSRAAMKIVNDMVSYQKVMASAADCIRSLSRNLLTTLSSHPGMAIAIETSHTFTLAQLVSKLSQTHCDGLNCTSLAPYMDVFTLTRRCLSVNGGCPNPRAPLTVICIEELPGFPDVAPRLEKLRRFVSIAGRYDDEFRVEGKPINEDEDADESYFYAYSDLRAEFYSMTTQWFFDNDYSSTASVPWSWKLCSVVAPWIKDRVGESEMGVFCDECSCSWRDEEGHERNGWPPSIQYVLEQGWELDDGYPETRWPDPMSVAFMKVEELEEHREKGEHTEGKLPEFHDLFQ